MSNLPYFFLTLDTTQPKITIYAPNTSNRLTVDEIRVDSSEPLMDWQNIYLIDSEGTRHDLTFSRVSNTEYVGQLSFSGYPYGIATLFVQLQDEVGNKSALETHTIKVVSAFDTLLLNMELTEIESKVEIGDTAGVDVIAAPINGGLKATVSEKVLTPTISDKSFVTLDIKDFD